MISIIVPCFGHIVKFYKKITPYPDINEILFYFKKKIKAILENNFVGMYLYGSLATGGFDKETSDIDFIIITQKDISAENFSALFTLHAQFHSSNSPWAQKIEVAYIATEVFSASEKSDKKYPQLEKGDVLIEAALEMGWAFQCYSLREHGITITGPAPRSFIPTINNGQLFHSAHSIITLWHQQAHDEQEVIGWLNNREEQKFVVLTLCRFHYFIHNKTLASKSMAAQWAMANLGIKWIPLIEKAIKNTPETVNRSEMQDTIAFIDYTTEILLRFRII